MKLFIKKTINAVRLAKVIKKFSSNNLPFIIFLKALNKIETLYVVVLNDKVPDNIKECSFDELKNILNSSISSINATIINFYDVQYMQDNQKEFREFVDSIEAIRLYSMEVSERNLPYTSGNNKICEAFQSMNVEEIVSGKQK